MTRHEPDWADTHAEAAYYRRELDRHEDERADQRRDALADHYESNVRLEDCGCGRRECLTCAFRRVFGGAA